MLFFVGERPGWLADSSNLMCVWQAPFVNLYVPAA